MVTQSSNEVKFAPHKICSDQAGCARGDMKYHILDALHMSVH